MGWDAGKDEERILRRYGFFVLLPLAMIPNPIFDAVGLLAGSLGYPPIRRFWLACAPGNSVKYAGMAFSVRLRGAGLAEPPEPLWSHLARTEDSVDAV